MDSLRTRKKAQTRQRIIEAADQLAQKNGYQATTIADICLGADIAQRTFFSYFPSKEAVFLSSKQELLEKIASVIDNRPSDTTTFQVFRLILEQYSAQDITQNRDLFAYHQGLANETRQLRAYSDSLDQQMESVLRRGFARDLGQPAEALGPTLAAGVTSGALHVIFRRERGDDAAQSKEQVMATLDQVLAFLEAGIATLA